MTPELAQWLACPAGQQAIGAAERASRDHPQDELAAATALRRADPQLTPEQSAAAVSQVLLRRLALTRHGIQATGLLLTRDGLEQATRPAVAQRRARLLRAAGTRRVLDLTGGLGIDDRAFLDEGLAVTTVERDPATAALLAHNCPEAEVVTGDSMALLADPGQRAALLGSLGPQDVVFADPARRDPAAPRGADLRARPERDPERWSPAWSALAGLPHPRIVVKAAPGFTPPLDWSAEWVSVHRTVVECAAYSWPALDGNRQAVMLTDHTANVLAASPDPLPTPLDGVAEWLLDPDPSIARAGALSALIARHPGIRQAGERSSWLTAAAPPSDEPFLRAYPVLAELAGPTTAQRRLLDERGVSALSVRSADVGLAPASVLRELRRREGNDLVLVITRVGDRQVRYLCGPAQSRSG